MQEQEYQFYKRSVKCLDCSYEFFLMWPYEFEDIAPLICVDCGKKSYIDIYKEEGLFGFNNWYKNKYGSIKENFDKEYNKIFYSLINKCSKCGGQLEFEIYFKERNSKCPKCSSKNIKEDNFKQEIVFLRHSEIDWVKYTLPK